MIGNCIGMIINGAKTLLGKKSTQDILKYLGTVTLAHLGNKYKINQYKYDPVDMKNMIYHYNMNNNHPINKDIIGTTKTIKETNKFRHITFLLYIKKSKINAAFR